MNEQRLPKSTTLKQLPPKRGGEFWPAIQEQVRRSKRKLVVIDDDPTGSQVVRNIPVLTGWSQPALEQELKNDLPAFFIITNSRSLLLPEARAMNAEIGRSLAKAVENTGRPVAVVSRSDSTLRGHFPGEVEAFAKAFGQDFDAWLIIPALPSAGRHTINDVHYVAEEDWLIPAGDSPYAQDATFGYQASNLKEWVAEKTEGRVPAAEVSSVSLDDIRLGGPDQVKQSLLSLPRGAFCIINAVTDNDLEVFSLGLLAAEAEGRRYLYRTGPTFVPARLGQAPYPLLEKTDLNLAGTGGGLIVVGSYVPKTSTQVESLLRKGDVSRIEIQVENLLEEPTRQEEIQRVASQATERLVRSQDTVIYTTRKLITGKDARDSRAIGQQISSGVIEILHHIQARPRYILAKGGITSSDVASKGLKVQRAMVMGQIVTGVSVWELGPESRYPGIPYMVFPGNVGGPDALAEVVLRLKTEEGQA